MAAAEDADAFAREYGNVWSRSWRHVIDPVAYTAARRAAPMPPGPLALGVDVDVDRAHAWPAVAGPDGHLELPDPLELEHAAAWLLQRAEREHAPIAVDRHGPAGTLHDALVTKARGTVIERRSLILPMTGPDVANAAATFVDDLHAGALVIYPNPTIDAAVDVATKRPIGDGGWGWSRRGSSGNVAPLIAASAARWALRRHAGTPAAPALTSGVSDRPVSAAVTGR